MAATKPPPREVVTQIVLFKSKQEIFTPKELKNIGPILELAKQLRRIRWTREEALAQYQWLRLRLGRTPTKKEVAALAQMGICPSYATLAGRGILRQIREERDRSRSDTCAKCGNKKPLAMFLGASSLWVCKTCYQEITGKSQNKKGICPRCRRGPKPITYRDPELGNVCEACGRKPRHKQPAISA